MIGRLELFESNLKVILQKFFSNSDGDRLFNDSLSNIFKAVDKPEHQVIRQWNGYEYTYGYQVDLNISYSILVDPETKEGYMFFYFWDISINGSNKLMVTTKNFSKLKGFSESMFQYVNPQRYVEYIYGELGDRTLESLVFYLMMVGVRKRGAKRKDTSMHMLTILFISYFFEFEQPFDAHKLSMKIKEVYKQDSDFFYYAKKNPVILTEDFLRYNVLEVLNGRVNLDILIHNISDEIAYF